MKHLSSLLLTYLSLLLLTTGCDKNSTEPSADCSKPVGVGDHFVLDGNDVTVLELVSDKWCACCEVCDCFAAPFALLLVEGDSVRVGGEFMSITMVPQTGEYNGRTIVMNDLKDGTCEDQLDREDLSACFSIE